MIWSNRDGLSQDGTDTGYKGLYKWTVDALFGSRVSPSRKYKEFSQDDTNYNTDGRRKRREKRYNNGFGDEHGDIVRSNSFSGFESDFYDRHELLPDLNDDEISQYEGVRDIPSIESQRRRSPIIPSMVRNEPTDTFATRRKGHNKTFDDDFSIVPKSPSLNDPIISRLFEKESRKEQETPQLPGKYPSPARQKTYQIDYTNEYLDILDQLDKNEKVLSDISKSVHEKRMSHQKQEEAFKVKYNHTRSELIKELKHSKVLYDNYYKLYGKYQQLKALSQDVVYLQSQVSNLETQLVDSAIEKEKQVHSLSKRLLELELKLKDTESSKEGEAQKYKRRIAELEASLEIQHRPKLSDISSFSFSPARSHIRDQTSMSDYNDVVDTHFLKNLQ